MIFDGPTKALTDFATSVSFSDLPDSVTHASTRSYLNSIASAAAGFDNEPATIARTIAADSAGPTSVFGIAQTVVTEPAVFANTLMTRYADFNDGGLSSGHLSDMGPAIMALAERENISGDRFIAAMYVAYQVAGQFGSAVNLRNRAWDQGLYHSVATVAGLGNLLRLDPETIANAIAIAVTPSIPLRVTRAGELSHWKSGAAAHATMSATFAVRLAKAGMTGPRRVFEGIEGLFEKVTGPFELKLAPAPGAKPVVQRVQHKVYPAIIEAQGPISLMLELRKQFKPEDVESIVLTTEHLGWHEGGGGQGDVAEKWDPKTKETADHSLPYVLAVALVDGYIAGDSYSRERIADPNLRPLMKRIAVEKSDAHTARRKEKGEIPAELVITLKDGRKLEGKLDYPRGHRENPVTDEELTGKFDRTIPTVLDDKAREELKDRLWNITKAKDVKAITALYRQWSVR